MKCDESKPNCLRCIKFKIDCGGYDTTNGTKAEQKAAKGPPRPIPILPSSARRGQALFLQPLGGILFQSNLEARYFVHFREHVVPELTGPFSSSLWSQIMLQACQSESCVLEATVALAALRMSLSTIQESTTSLGSSEILAQHYHFALQQYGKAIRNMRKALASSNTRSNNRKALICCLLIFCFEAFQGNHSIATLHAKSGCRLLQNWLAANSSTTSHAEGISFAGHTAIEDDLVRAFNRLELQIMTYTDSSPLEGHKFASKHGGSIVADMPEIFSDFDEANRYWELVMWRNHHFIHSAIAPATGNTDIHSSMSAASKIDLRAGIGSLIRSFYNSDRFPILQTEHSLYSTEISRWQSAFKPFLSPTNGHIHGGAAILQMHSISTQITLDLLLTGKDTLNRHADKFQNILYLARSGILGLGQESFNMDLGIIPSLYVILGNCHDLVLQHEVRQILASTIRREGVWNSLDVQIKAVSLD